MIRSYPAVLSKSDRDRIVFYRLRTLLLFCSEYLLRVFVSFSVFCLPSCRVPKGLTEHQSIGCSGFWDSSCFFSCRIVYQLSLPESTGGLPLPSCPVFLYNAWLYTSLNSSHDIVSAIFTQRLLAPSSPANGSLNSSIDRCPGFFRLIIAHLSARFFSVLYQNICRQKRHIKLYLIVIAICYDFFRKPCLYVIPLINEKNRD